jgi:replicative DNA helicase
MNEAEVGAIALLATVLNELEENKKKVAADPTDARHEGSAGGLRQRLEQAESRVALLTAEQNEMRAAVAQARRWAGSWKRAATRHRAGYLTELSRHERTAQQLQEAMREFMQLQDRALSLPSDAIDAYAEYRENLGLATRSAKKRALRDLRRSSTL